MTESVPLVISDAEIKNAVKLINLITDFLPFVFICSSIKDTKISLQNRYLMYFKIGAIDESKRRCLWNYYLDFNESDIKILSSRYRLTAGQIAGVCRNCNLNADMKSLISEIMLLNSENSLSQIIHPMFRIDDLIADEHIITVLNQIIKTAKNLSGFFSKNTDLKNCFLMAEDWEYYSYGASGTGKTMSAYILASELGLDVMKVDLSRIEDKYIGETEKEYLKSLKRQKKIIVCCF